MSSRTSRLSTSSSRKVRPSSSSPRMKKTDDWTEVTEPDERRRIQNRIAQRKFREKAREQRDRAAREAQNQQYADAVYHIPDPEDFSFDDGGDLSGLPWGGLSMRHVVTRGHIASASTHSHSHHSGSSSVMTHNPGPAPVDQALYQMNPYGYAAHPGSLDSTATSNSDLYAYAHESPYAGAYYDYEYDYDPVVAGGDGPSAAY
ncbi:hypothetical protein VTJ83DRAFT_3474 [Remersonia thermophila]|uniref:BZIP domain-containing protein n=1 Tax=Remersonia thermophila TaxID=72144 RepID=A0ABR4DE28_9PEZI